MHCKYIYDIVNVDSINIVNFTITCNIVDVTRMNIAVFTIFFTIL